MNQKTMEQFEEAVNVALNTQQELTLRSQPESNRILIKSLGQILTTLKNQLETLNADTPK
jgi:hypothetical protein|tara:strand:- start:312 stop:491 length:180 start_codon:yes stop_codon:yes gene_type:complete